MTVMAEIEKNLYANIQENLDMVVGDTVRVHVRIREGEKQRIQIFAGTVIRIRKGGPRATFTVRKVSYAVGVERVFPLYSPWLEKIEVQSRHKVRRAKLYFLRELRGKKARLKEDRSWRRR